MLRDSVFLNSVIRSFIFSPPIFYVLIITRHVFKVNKVFKVYKNVLTKFTKKRMIVT
nr:MAG TPA: hypothetical protein [Caudoviricetes sp.]